MSKGFAALIASALLASAVPVVAAPPPAPAPLVYNFRIQMERGEIYNPWTRSNDRVELRSFVGTGTRPGDFIAPEIRVRPGQKLKINLDNRLPACPQGPGAPTCFNDTNLHTHGLWISPSGHSDNVMISIRPGEQFQYEYDVPADHPAGTFWYHPHNHGSGNVQISSGMAGPLIVTGDRAPTLTRPGDIDILLRDRFGRFAERTLLFQQIDYGCFGADGKLKAVFDSGLPVRPWICDAGDIGRMDSDDQDWGWRFSGRFPSINGQVQPVLKGAVAGRFERWRLISGTTGEGVRISFYRLAADAPDLRAVPAADQDAWRERYCQGEPLPMWHIASDGLTRPQMRETREGIVFAGERADFLTRFPAAGRYCVVNVSRAPSTAKPTNPSKMLSMVEVGESTAASETADPAVLLRDQLVAAAEQVLSGDGQADIRQAVIANLKDGLKTPAFAWHHAVSDDEVGEVREFLFSELDTSRGPLFHINGRSFDHERIDLTLPLGGVEEWRVTSVSGGHAFHVHVNPFQVLAVLDHEDRPVTDPASPAYDPDYAGVAGQWRDSLYLKEGLNAVFRTRFERFTGDFMLHCHILFHGDHGMTQHVRIVDPAHPETPEAPTHH